jgi:chemotaxis protein CheD
VGRSFLQADCADDLPEGAMSFMPQLDTDQFAHIRRMRDHRFPYEIASILPGEFFVSRDPMVVYTVLGSCISACIRDPIAGVGGMNHFMLPERKDNGSDSWGESTRYGSYAMESLINEILKRGGAKSRLEIKLFGAGKIYEGSIDVGANNAKWVIGYLKSEGLETLKTDLGDVFPRKVYYFTDSGRVLMKKIEHIKNKTIFERENDYAAQIKQREQLPVEDVTLF